MHLYKVRTWIKCSDQPGALKKEKKGLQLFSSVPRNVVVCWKI